jgi:hypothetical protein
MTTNRFDEIRSDTIRAGIDRLVNTVAACQGTLDCQDIITKLDKARFYIHKHQQRVLGEEKKAKAVAALGESLKAREREREEGK